MSPNSLAALKTQRDRIQAAIVYWQKLLVSYEAVIADIEADGRSAQRTEKKMKGVAGVAASVEFTTSPPEVRVRVRAPVPEWDGKAPIPPVMAAENALRDAAFYLFGRRTGPGYTLSLKPAKLSEDRQWIETRVLVIPKDEDRARLAKKLEAACGRARMALAKAGANSEALPATEAPKGQEVVST